jgi:MFS family permease
MGRLVAVSAIGFGLSLICFSISRNLFLSVVLLYPVGLSMMTQMASSNTLIQAMCPDRLRGRVMAAYSMVFMGMAPFGALVAGSAAEALGAAGVVALGGCWSIIAGLFFARMLPHVRAEARQLILAQQASAGEPAEETSLGFGLAQDRKTAEAPQTRRP